MHFYSDHEGNPTVHDNELVLGCYLHEGINEGEREWEITSIQSVKFLPQYQLTLFLHCFDYLFPKHAPELEYELERWYKFKIRFTGYKAEQFEIVSFEDVSETDNDYDRIH